MVVKIKLGIFKGDWIMEITEKVVSNISIYSIIGQIKISTQKKCRNYFHNVICKKSNLTVILNMTQLEYINNAGLSVIVECYNKFKEDGGRMVLCGLVSTVAELFNMVKLDHLLEIYPDEESALEAVFPIDH